MPRGNLTYRRGEIHWVRLDPTVGAEVQKTRSCLIIQNDIMNQYGLLTVVIPFRPGNKQAPYVVNVKASPTNGLDKDRFLDVAQILAIDGQRVLGVVGTLEAHYWQEIQAALDIVLGFAEI
ncbi:MAG: type II toxin-antitoxin system PemK/MazF family toxin [Hydrococcus sp. RM1_1_31]|nr:type II toxin-antitoxin system PemK/MazF family toxin [Hydrococcus sp. RM1_1_31]